MKKIGIVTIIDYSNYGNRLQNYATQEVLKSLGFNVITIVNAPKPANVLSKIKRMPINVIISKAINKAKNFKKNIVHRQRIAALKKFTDAYIFETDTCITEKYIPNNFSDEFDYFVTGSDQVWNPTFRYGSPIDFLTFAPKHKRIAYAPSFGVSKIPSDYVKRYKEWLSEIPYLSVREHAGAKIIKELTGREAVVLIDPTLMLPKERWLSIAKPAKNKPKKEYMLTYFLGGIPNEYKRKIYGIAKKNNLQVINLADINDRQTYIVGPSEFIDFINSASLFCTDSFHGVVFSILLETPFIVFDRVGNFPSMNSRIETILSTFKLESRHQRNIDDASIFNADYSHVDLILERERKKALDFLKKALNIEAGF